MDNKEYIKYLEKVHDVIIEDDEWLDDCDIQLDNEEDEYLGNIGNK